MSLNAPFSVPEGEMGYFSIQGFAGQPYQPDVTVEYEVTPAGGSDHTLASGSVTLHWSSPGGTTSASIPIQTLADNEIESAEQVTVTLKPDPLGRYTIGVYGVPPQYMPPYVGSTTATIVDRPPMVNIYPLQDGREGGDSLRFHLTRSGGDTESPVSVMLGVSSAGTATAADIELPEVSILTDLEIDVPVADDSEAEWTENVILQVLAGGSSLPGITWEAEGWVYDDDVSIGELPQMMLANNDDDNDNDVIDMNEPTAWTSDDDLFELELTFPQAPMMYAAVQLVLTGPLKAYYLDGSPLPTYGGLIAWDAMDGTAPSSILIAAVGGVTQQDGASIELRANDWFTSQSATTRTTPVSLDVQYRPGGGDPQVPGDVLVGEWIAMSASVVAPEGWVADALQWSVTGTRYRWYDAQSGTLTPLAGAELEGPGVGFFWSDAPNGQSDEEVSCSAVIAGLTVTQSARFAVFEPTSSLSAVIADAKLIWEDALTGYLQLSTNAAQATDGIAFAARVDMPAEFSATTGEFQFVQMVKLGRYWTGEGKHWGLSLNGEWVLDSQVPYEDAVPTGQHMVTEDSPGMPLQPTIDVDPVVVNLISDEARVDEEFRMYLMFRPSSGTWVPLRRVVWSWNATATFDPIGTWSLSDVASDASSEETSEFPIWDSIATETMLTIEVP